MSPLTPYKPEVLYNTLKEAGIIDEKLLTTCYEESKKLNIAFDEILVKKDALNDISVGKIIADIISIPYVNLAEVSIDERTLKIIPEKVAKQHNVIAFLKDSSGIHIATSTPPLDQLAPLLHVKTGLPIIVNYAPSWSIKKSLSQYKRNITQAFDDIIAENILDAKKNTSATPPIIKIVDTIIDYAYQNNASDIHIEPLEEMTLVRFRIDGILHDIVELPHDLDNQIVTRIKVMANLRTDEHQEAQDGKIIFHTEEENLDLRVSIAPITKGEKIVMRLLSERSRQFGLSDLGFSEHDLKKIETAYKLPHGMILVTGPTGSGKTTTLYAILKLINSREINIMTIEDPVEYQIDNVNQIQVNQKTNLTFAKGLRSIVRQDPDVILVGEVRDNETAEIAINSAMTGHLVLSTLHTNDAVTAFPRLIDMEIEPYLIASTINVVVAQRLVRKICAKCKVSFEIPYKEIHEQMKPYIHKKEKILFYRGKGCALCRQTGYSGRIGIFEVLVMADNLNKAIIAKKSSQDLHAIAVKNGMRTMFEDGVDKIIQGLTTIEELLRVSKE